MYDYQYFDTSVTKTYISVANWGRYWGSTTGKNNEYRVTVYQLTVYQFTSKIYQFIQKLS